MANETESSHFRVFAGFLDTAIQQYGEAPEDPAEFVARQREQVEKLFNLEKAFRLNLSASRMGRDVYEAFVDYIRDERRNILAARPFFRERQEKFTEQVSVALHARDPVALQAFAINFQFVKFALRVGEWGPRSQVLQLGELIESTRRQLIEVNAPLAIAQATAFFRKTPTSHLSRMDLIQTAMEGLCAGVDKYSGGYDNRVYRQMVIGRIVGNLINDYSETTMHFYPSDKRVLYNANKSRRHFSSGGNIDYEGLTKKINETAKREAYCTDPNALAALMGAASTVSADASFGAEDGEAPVSDLVEKFASDEADRPDSKFEDAELVGQLYKSAGKLPLRQQKVLRMRGVQLG